MTESQAVPIRANIRAITSHKDFERLLDIQIDSISELTAYTDTERQAWIDYLRNETADRYATFQNRGYVDKQGNLVAFVSWTVSGDSANIECLYVLAMYRGQKIGKILLQEAEAHLKNKTVHVRSTLNAQPFYQKNGYSFVADDVSRAGFRIALLQKHL